MALRRQELGDGLAKILQVDGLGQEAGAFRVGDLAEDLVGGSLAAGQGDRLLGPARAAIEHGAFRRPASRVAVVSAMLGDDVGLVGGLVLFGERFGEVDGAGAAETRA